MKLGIYRYYKGMEYEVVNVALDTVSQRKMVVYRALYDCPDLAEEYGMRPWFVRPYDMFNGTLEVDGKEVKRFEYVGNLQNL